MLLYRNEPGTRRVPGILLGRRSGLVGMLAVCALSPVWRLTERPSGDPIYIGSAVVTGTDNRDRPRGLGTCLSEVLVKVSGDPNILSRPGIPALKACAASMVTTISYRDRMSALPKHDEQGTRDRPFTLTATFDPAKITKALASLGVTSWRGTRPQIFLTVAVRSYAGNFALIQGPTTGYDQPNLMRSALSDAADRYALTVVLPVTTKTAAPAGALLVNGTLDWSDKDHGWIASWQAVWHSARTRWGERGVSFDEALADALAGALGIASGHGPPRG
jgi:uncharacterized protein